MKSQILCNWLGLPDKEWPPDHYALLGLKPGECDRANIEKTVHDRMAKLRSYQLSHPEEATEGMNRVAQAYITLMEAAAKPTRPGPAVVATAMLPQKQRAPGKASGFAPASKDDTLVSQKTQIDWKRVPPPVRVASGKSGSQWTAPPPATPPAQEASPSTSVVAAAPPPPPVTGAAPESVHVTLELAQQSPEARRGLSTLPALIDRIYLTRQLLTAWKALGRYVSEPARKLNRLVEEVDFTRRLGSVFEHMASFPPLLGHPGKPGYRVVAMARLEMTPAMFKMLDEPQRQDLARDWEAGQRVLLAHRKFLRHHLKTLRRRGRLRLLLEPIRATINDHPGWVFAVISVLAVLCAVLYLLMW